MPGNPSAFGLLLLGLVTAAHAQLPAFPGAEGFGSFSNGGRGGDVYTVTNLNSSGAGSFADAVATAPSSGRTIVFAVSGHIRLPSGSGGGLTLNKNKITVAGQTAPGDGICFWNNTMNLTGSDLVIRHIRWRYGKQLAGGDSVDIANSQRIILDHCDVMFSTDENISSFGTPPEFFTFQWSVNAWGLQNHSCGGLWDINHATAHHTLWANNHTRNPKCISPSVFDWSNNVTFGWNNGFNLAVTTDPIARVNIRSSWFIHGGSTTSAVYGGGLNTSGQNVFQLHMSDSALDGSNNGILDATRTNYAMVSATQYTQTPTAWPQTLDGNAANPVIGVPVTLDSRNTAYKKVLSKAGAVRMEIGSRPLRDEITQLCVNRVVAMQRGIISDPLELNLSTGTAFASLQAAAAPADTDLDGMPDDFEDAVGYDKSVADNNTALTAPETAASFFPAGSPTAYTRLEEYLHFKAVPHGTVAKRTNESPSSIEIDLRKFTSGFTASPVFTLSNISGGTATQSGPGNAIVTFTPTLDFSGRGGFLFTVTDSAGDSWTQQCCLLVSTKTQPRPITWTGDGISNNWDTATANFTSSTGTTTFADGDAVTIDDTGSNTPNIQITGALAPASLTVSNSTKNFTLAGSGSLAGGTLSKTGSGTLTVSNTGPNSFSSAALDAGTLSFSTTNALGTGPLTLKGGTLAFSADLPNPLVFAGSVALNPSGSRDFNGSWTGSGTVQINNTGSNLITLQGNTSPFSGDVNFAASSGSARLNGSTGSSNAAFDLGTGTFTLFSRNGGSFQLGSLGGGSNTSLSGTSSADTVSTYTIGALNTSTTFNGRITNGGAAATAITKTGSGTLTLTNDSNYTGNTNVNAGSLEVAGSLGATPVSIAANASLTGSGTLGGSVTSTGGIISPGGNNGHATGTLTAASLALTNPTLRFDLSSNPSSGNDLLTCSPGGAITLTGAQNFIFNLTDGQLSPGTYELINTTGPLTVSGISYLTNMPTDTRQGFWFTRNSSGSAPGYLRLNISGTTADLTWTGANGGLWDRQTTAAWSGASPATFYNADDVTFDDTASTGTVSITQAVAPESITVNNTTLPYTFTGSAITGSASLVKSGGGTLTLNIPQYTLTNCATTNGSATLTVSSTANLLPGMTVTGSGIPSNTTIATVVSATSLTLSQNATATSSTATLTFETRNTFSGGTFLNGGSLVLTSNAAPTSNPSAPANPYGLGSGPITFNGGSLTLHGHTGSTDPIYGALPNDLIVPAGQTGHLFDTVRGLNSVPFASLGGSLTGSGTLDLTVNYYRSAITGDWSAFAGILNVKRPVSGATDPRIQFGGTTGLPLATVNLEQVRMEYTATPPAEGIIIPIGSLSGPSNAVISGSQNAAGTVIWQIGALNTSTTFAGDFTPYSTYPIGLEKTGTGTLTLTGTGTLNAGINVEQGTLSYGDAPTDTLGGTGEITVSPSATLQFNSGAKLAGSSCEVFTGGTLHGYGTLEAPLSSSGTISVSGGTLAITGSATLGGTLALSSLTDRLAVTGNLDLAGTLQLPSTGLSLGRKLLATYTGNLTTGETIITNVPPAYLAVLDTATPGEVAVVLYDMAAYQAWQTTYFGSTTSPDSQPPADPDNDGMTNIEEYEAGTEPNNPSSFIPLVWQGGVNNNAWDLATTANWLENTTPRVFRDKRQVSITDTGSNSPAITLTGSLQPGALTVSNSTKAFTLSGTGSLDGPTGLVKSGSNSLTLATSNNYSGPTAINEGVVNLQSNTALGSTAGSTTVANNARLELQGNIAVTGETLTLSGQGGASFYNGALNAKSGTNTWAGPLTLAATGTRIGAQAGATLAVSGPITSAPGSTGLIVRPNDITSTVVLSGPNTYTGDSSIIGGVLRLGASDTLPITTTLRFGLSNVSGKLDLDGFDQEVAGIALSQTSGTFTNEITSGTPATLTVNTAADSTLAVPLTGSAALTKSGPATLTVSSAHSYAGSTTAASGKLLLDFSSASTSADLLSPSSPPVFAGGTLELKGKPATTSSQTLASPTLAPNTSSTITLTPNGATSTSLTLGDAWTIGENATLLIDLSTGNCTVFSNPALTGGLLPGVSVKDSIATGPATVIAGQIVRYIPPTLTISSNDPDREFSTLNSTYPGGTLDWTNGGLLTNRAVHRLILDTTVTGGTIDMGAPTNILTLTSGEIQFSGPNNLTLTGGQIGASGSTVFLTTEGTSTLTLGSPLSGGAGSLAITGSANVILNSPSTFTGGLTLDGGSLKQGVAGALGSSNGTLTIHSGTLDLNGLTTGIGALSGNGGIITSATAATLTLGNNNATGGEFAGSISGSIALTKTGSGTQILTGNNPYSGLTTINAGILRSGADHAIGNGNLTVTGGTLDLQNFSDTVAAVTLSSGSITGTSGLLTATSYSLTTGSVSARLGGASAPLAKSGSTYSNTATLSGSNTYGGATTLGTDSGTLALAHNSALGNTPSVTVSGSGTALRLADGVTISGIPITIRGNGANNGVSAGSFSGSLTTSDNAIATWSGSVTLGDASARIGTGNNGTLNLSGAILGSGANQSVSFSSGTEATLGTVVLSGPNNFTGNISIVRGSLKLGATDTLPATAIIDVGSANIADHTTFDLNGFSQTLAGLKRTSTNTNQVSTVTNSSATAATLTLNQSTAQSYSGRITGNLTLAKTGSGTLTLSSTATLDPAVSVVLDGGALSLASGHTVTALRINGAWMPAGIYNSTNSSGRITGGGSLTVTTNGPIGFTSWIDGFTSLSPDDKLPGADPDHDSVNNLLEYVLGGLPDQMETGILPVVSLTPTHFVFTFTQREESAATTTQIFEYGTNLTGWTSLNITAPISPEVSLGTVSNGIRTVTVNIPLTASPDGRLFGRLKVSQP